MHRLKSVHKRRRVHSVLYDEVKTSGYAWIDKQFLVQSSEYRTLSYSNCHRLRSRRLSLARPQWCRCVPAAGLCLSGSTNKGNERTQQMKTIEGTTEKSIAAENVRGMNSIEVGGVADVNTGLSVGGKSVMVCCGVSIC